MGTSADIGLPELAQAQAFPEITFNEALVLIQAVALNGVIDKDLTAPPGSPTEGDAYLINTATPTGAWALHPYRVAIYWGGAWRFIPGNDDAGTPIVMGARQVGLRVYVRDERCVYIWSATATSPASYLWRKLTAADIANVPAGNIAATTIQAAIDELDSEKFAKTDLPVSAVGALPFYEEGTFTPVLSFVTPGDLSVAYSTQRGRYTRMGNLVHVTVEIVTSTFTHTTAASGLVITGLPFAIDNSNTSDRWVGAAGYQGYTSATHPLWNAVVQGNDTSQLRFNKMGSGQTLTGVVPADMPTGGSVRIRASCLYRRA